MLNTKIKSLFIFVISILIANSAFSTTIYISTRGNDANVGTRESPLASLAGARDKIRALKNQGNLADIQVVIAAGNYFMKDPVVYTAEDGGSGTISVSYVAEAGARPVFYGGIEVKGFEKVNDRLWRAHLPEVQRLGWGFEQLYVSGNRAVRAKFPNLDFYRPKAVKEVIIEKGTELVPHLGVQKISLLPEQAAILNTIPAAELQDAVVTFYHKWDNTRKKIFRYSAKDTAIYIVGKGMKPWNKIDKETLFTIENVKKGLDDPGEWYLEVSTGYLYYVPKPDESISETTFFAPVHDKFLTIQGSKEKKVENLRFENISFQVAGYKMPESGNEPMQAAASIEAAVMVDYATKIQFINCEIAHTGSNAIWFRKACSDSKVEHCYLHDLGAGGIKIGEINLAEGGENTRNIVVNNNIVRGGGYVFPCAVALVIFTASDNELTHNEIADFSYSGISAGWIWGYGKSTAKRNKIEFNHIHHVGWGVLSDMGGVYTLGPSEGTSVSNNVIHHVYSRTYGGWGLYTDEGSTGIVMENNLVYSCKSSAFHQNYGKDNTIRNNIFYNQIRAQLESTRIEPHNGFNFTNNIICYNQGNLTGIRWDKTNFVADYNAYWDTRTRDISIAKQSFKDWQKAGKDKHSIIADPKFADPATLDFRIKNKSLMSKINFKPFDYTKAGVYGSKEWVTLAKFDDKRAAKFDEMVKQQELNPVHHTTIL
ncbi:right-handed parallel beta-helix repeat-containing protein [Pedobacter sp. ok626]|uniref:right-handed parallel beta-helix repeat-containing protein n=1 Tax=Pedobacter sp. ok626 TaxID=1761882 RepID=UPI001404DC88|nr:right-handed parallel beta-helix repeat-containing protein [Pedobacter sp. ok626]